jgi:hypothetical protein
MVCGVPTSEIVFADPAAPLPELPPQPELSSAMVRVRNWSKADDLADRLFKADRELRMRRPRSSEVQDNG